MATRASPLAAAPIGGRSLAQALLRAWDRLSIYLPVMLMAVLALLTYWLVRNTPIFITPPGAPPPAQEQIGRAHV